MGALKWRYGNRGIRFLRSKESRKDLREFWRFIRMHGDARYIILRSGLYEGYLTKNEVYEGVTKTPCKKDMVPGTGPAPIPLNPLPDSVSSFLVFPSRKQIESNSCFFIICSFKGVVHEVGFRLERNFTIYVLIYFQTLV